MDRLTKWTLKGAVLLLDSPKSEEEAREQLKEKYKKAVNQLATYEDEIESGEFLEFPRIVNKYPDTTFIVEYIGDNGLVEQNIEYSMEDAVETVRKIKKGLIK